MWKVVYPQNFYSKVSLSLTNHTKILDLKSFLKMFMASKRVLVFMIFKNLTVSIYTKPAIKYYVDIKKQLVNVS